MYYQESYWSQLVDSELARRFDDFLEVIGVDGPDEQLQDVERTPTDDEDDDDPPNEAPVQIGDHQLLREEVDCENVEN